MPAAIEFGDQKPNVARKGVDFAKGAVYAIAPDSQTMSFLYLARNDIHEPVRSDQDLKHAGFKDAPVSLHTAICSMWRRGLLHRLRGFDLF